MISDREHECMERGELEALQLSRLQEMVERIYNHVPFYKEKLDEADMSPEKITKSVNSESSHSTEPMGAVACTRNR